MVAPSRNLKSIGKLAEVFQRSPGAIRAAFDALEIGPSLTLNDIAYFEDHDVDRVLQRLAERGTTRPPARPHGHAAPSK